MYINININKYTCYNTGEINLCAAFYDYMEHRKRKVTHFAQAITMLEEMMDVEPVHSPRTAMEMIMEAVEIAYGNNVPGR